MLLSQTGGVFSLFQKAGGWGFDVAHVLKWDGEGIKGEKGRRPEEHGEDEHKAVKIWHMEETQLAR
jgi:hypothetical protein